jgi:RNA polymerase sigma-70 factor (ECF subfamily)
VDSGDFDVFFAATAARLQGQLYLLTGDREEARDCVQEAFERAWLRWAEVSALAAPEAWVGTVARRLAVSRWRRARNSATARVRRHHHASTVPGPPSEDHVELVRALQQLPAAQREALVLHHLCDLDVAAVAAETDTNVNTVKSRLARGRAALAELLGEADDVPSGSGGR